MIFVLIISTSTYALTLDKSGLTTGGNVTSSIFTTLFTAIEDAINGFNHPEYMVVNFIGYQANFIGVDTPFPITSNEGSISGLTITGNKINLPAGSYSFDFPCQFHKTEWAACYIFNESTNTKIKTAAAYSGQGLQAMNRAVIKTVTVFNSATQISIRGNGANSPSAQNSAFNVYGFQGSIVKFK